MKASYKATCWGGPWDGKTFAHYLPWARVPILYGRVAAYDVNNAPLLIETGTYELVWKWIPPCPSPNQST